MIGCAVWQLAVVALAGLVLGGTFGLTIMAAFVLAASSDR